MLPKLLPLEHLLTKAALRDTARAFGLSIQEIDTAI